MLEVFGDLMRFVSVAMMATSEGDKRQAAEYLSVARRHIDTLIEEFGGGVDLNKFLSPCPPGYDTVLGYLAKHQPDTVLGMTDPVSGTINDGRRMRDMAARLGAQVIKVPASVAVASVGADSVNAYPTEILSRYFEDAFALHVVA